MALGSKDNILNKVSGTGMDSGMPAGYCEGRDATVDSRTLSDCGTDDESGAVWEPDSHTIPDSGTGDKSGAVWEPDSRTIPDCGTGDESGAVWEPDCRTLSDCGTGVKPDTGEEPGSAAVTGTGEEPCTDAGLGFGDGFDIQAELKKLPQQPGVYIMHGASDEVIYVGKAINLRNRVRQYFQSPKGKSPKIRKMITMITRFEYIVVDSETEALVLENNLIKEYSPRYNTLLKDDKTYPYIKVTVNEDFPRVFLTRKVRRDHARYFGPYTNAGAVRDTIELLRKLFRIRSCQRSLPRDTGKERACLYYHISQCLAPCCGYVSTAEYKKHIARAVEFLSGKYDPVKKYLNDKMLQASELCDFEKAIEYRDLIKSIDALAESQKVTTTDMSDRDIIGISALGTQAAVVVFFMRQGRMIGRDHFRLEIDPDEELPAMIYSFIGQYYGGTPYIPSEIWVQSALEDAGIIEQWLKNKSGHSVRVQVPRKGDKEKLVSLAQRNAETLLYNDFEKLKREAARTKGAEEALKELLELDRLDRIESYDISNTSGLESVGSMVVFVGGRPRNSDYRKFRIHEVQGPDDYASMREVLMRRFTHEERKTWSGVSSGTGSAAAKGMAISPAEGGEAVDMPAAAGRQSLDMSAAAGNQAMAVPSYGDVQGLDMPAVAANQARVVPSDRDVRGLDMPTAEDNQARAVPSDGDVRGLDMSAAAGNQARAVSSDGGIRGLDMSAAAGNQARAVSSDGGIRGLDMPTAAGNQARAVSMNGGGRTMDRSFAALPDLILMDGGKGQVNVALSVLDELGIVIPVCGMVKDDHHRTRGLYYNNEELPIDTHSEVFKLITRVQDETHRFAIEYHRSLRTKEQVHSVLDDIKGIGPKRRRALMKHFKDIGAIREAEVETLAAAEGMNRAAAEAVYSFFHGGTQD